MKKIFFIFVLLLCIGIFFLLYSHRETAVSINFVGDIIPHKILLAVAHNQDKSAAYAEYYRYVRPYLISADLAVCNLETPIAETNLKRTNAVLFDAPAEFALSLHSAGFRLINVANNHALDCGSKGFKQTVRNLYKNHFLVVGYSVKGIPHPVIYKTNNITIGFLSATGLLNLGETENSRHTNVVFLTTNVVLPAIRKLKSQVDYLIFIVHWGKEYITNQPCLREKAALLFAAGADAIVGHHPHILLPVEVQKKGGRTLFAAYSLGNFLSNQGRRYPRDKSQKSEDTRQSMILQLQIKKNKKRTFLSRIKIIPVWIMNNYNEYTDGLVKERRIFPFPLDFQSTNIFSAACQREERRKIKSILKMKKFDWKAGQRQRREAK